VIATTDGVALAPADHPDAIDHVVEMRRFDEALTLAARVSHGGEYYPVLVAVGRRLAEFHAGAASPAAGHATAALHAALAENTDTLLALAPDREFAHNVAGLARFTEAFFAARREDLETRAATGRVRGGHGDLRAEHVLLERGVEVVDCLEFDPALRVADVGCDLAFLLMDLEALGSPVAARAVLDGYRNAGADPGDDALLAFFAAYRALVRAKVSLVRPSQSADRARLVTYARARVSPRRAFRLGREAAGRRRLRGAVGHRKDPPRRRARRPRGPGAARPSGASQIGRSSSKRSVVSRPPRCLSSAALPCPSASSEPAADSASRAPCPTPMRTSSAGRPWRATWLMTFPPGSTSSCAPTAPRRRRSTTWPPCSTPTSPAAGRSSPQRRAVSCGWPVRRPAVASASQLREKGRS
jgi:aminoglycoside phosphotransferase family enzyme